MNKHDFLFEIGCEELPSHAQVSLSKSLHQQFSQAFADNKLGFQEIKCFSTPRRLAILVLGLDTTQAPQIIERQGPALSEAYDRNGTPTLVCLGFAKSSGVSVDQLTVKETPKGPRLVCVCKKPGAATRELLPDLVKKIISQLPLSKPMRWGNHDISFIRPVHWVVMLFGEELIEADILGLKTTRETMGHRFLHPKPIRITKPSEYAILLYSQGYVVADAEARKNSIRKSMATIVDKQLTVLLDDQLLNEVVALVEWPVVLKGSFDTDFLSIPNECLITAMQTHQKCFAVVDKDGALQPFFIMVSNIISKNPAAVIKGNESVIRARLSDAAFFYQKDKKQLLSDYLPRLDTVVYQDQLGSLGDKTRRITKLAMRIAKKIGADSDVVKKAATLSKCDLLTNMVGEFPNLQGTMGYYYALNETGNDACAKAIAEHYLPRFSGDKLPLSPAGLCIALADRIDTLVGILGINKAPTGDKDPFALRRAAQGIFRLLIEKNCEIDLLELLEESKKLFTAPLPNKKVVDEAFDFILARLKSYYIDQGLPVEIFEAVLACNPTSPFDFDRRIKAVLQFQQLPESTSLAAANKRVNNILKKIDISGLKKINVNLFEFDAERELATKLAKHAHIVNELYDQFEYGKALSELANLKEPIDQFFDSVMIMVEDEKKKQNRLSLLSSIRTLFSKVADISLLPS